MSVDDERTLRFGPQQGLMGLLNHREADAPVACILLNVGVTHRVGPRRLNVKLARALGAKGVTSLRFDLAGLGDSEAPAPGTAHTDQFAADLQSAMDGVEQAIGVGRFVLLGICSGAVNAYRVAQRDPRVVGLMMYDGYAHPTWRTRVVHDWRRANTLSVGGIVVNVGAVGSHAAIVSRELGVPCAVSVVQATARIPEGALISIDGSTGTVTVIEV
jgi:pimeloyl-ACP methyl ester carboxylesterase